jgi:hypothetical protein
MLNPSPSVGPKHKNFPFLQLSFNGKFFINDFVFHFYILKFSQLGFNDEVK